MKPVYDYYTEQIAALNPEKPCRVYRNLHTGLWSVKQDRVAFHTRLIYLKNVKFLVNEKLRQKVILEKKKNVHAFVWGNICSAAEFFDRNCVTPIYYNPYKVAHFTSEDGGACNTARVCQLQRIWNGQMLVYAKGVTFHTIPIDTVEDRGTMIETVEECLL